MPESVTPNDSNDPDDPLVERLRASVEHQADALGDAPDLPGRIHARVRRRRRQCQVANGSVFVLTIVALLAGALVLVPDDDTEDLHTAAAGNGDGAPERTTSTEAPKELGDIFVAESPTTVATDEPETTEPPEEDPPEASSTTMIEPPAEVLVNADTPLTFSGVGPIEAGMTVREAEQVAGVTIDMSASLAEEGSTCSTGQIGNSGIWVIAETSGAAGQDPTTGVVRVVAGGSSTEEGVYLGDPADQAVALYGTPTETVDDPYVTGGQVQVYARGGYAYGLTVDADGLVIEIQSGSAGWVPSLEGCA